MLLQNLLLLLVPTALSVTRAVVLQPAILIPQKQLTNNDSPLEAFCFEANPDIAGLGVLNAIYTQVFVSIFITFCAAWDRKFKRGEITTMTVLRQGNLILSCANAISGIIQISKKSLNAYHASIILSLGLLLDGPLLGTFSSISMCDAWGKLLEGDWRGARKDFWGVSREIISRREVYDVVVHNPLLSGLLSLARALNATLAIGIISTITTPDCGQSLKGGVGMPVLGKASKICWGILSAIRLVDVVAAAAKIAEQIPPEKSPRDDHRDVLVHRLAFIKLVVALTVAIVVVIDVEVLRSRAKSAALLSEEETVWGFGQILAMCVLVAQVIDISRMLWNQFHGKRTEHSKGEHAGQTRGEIELDSRKATSSAVGVGISAGQIERTISAGKSRSGNPPTKISVEERDDEKAYKEVKILGNPLVPSQPNHRNEAREDLKKLTVQVDKLVANDRLGGKSSAVDSPAISGRRISPASVIDMDDISCERRTIIKGDHS